jgi:hypothetical protein
MRAYIAVVLLTAGLVAPALAETAPPLVNVQQPTGERAAQLQRQKAYRRAAATRAAQAKQTRDTAAGAAQGSGPTRIVPGSQVVPAASSSSSWSSSMLSWWRGESTPAGAGQGTDAQVSAEPAAVRVETAAATPEPVKPTRRKVRRARSSETTATGAVPATSQAETKVEKPTRSKRRSAKRPRSKDRQSAARATAVRQADRARDTVPEPRPKPVNPAVQDGAPQAASDSAVGSISPAEIKESGGQQMAALSSEDAAAGGEATWWQRQGNPVVFNFRDCVASYASREAQRNKDGTWADLLIRATEGDCRAPFDEMARTLAKRFGEARIEPVMRELIDTTFLPAAKQAAAESAPAPATGSSDVPPLPPIPDNIPTQ